MPAVPCHGGERHPQGGDAGGKIRGETDDNSGGQAWSTRVKQACRKDTAGVVAIIAGITTAVRRRGSFSVIDGQNPPSMAEMMAMDEEAMRRDPRFKESTGVAAVFWGLFSVLVGVLCLVVAVAANNGVMD